MPEAPGGRAPGGILAAMSASKSTRRVLAALKELGLDADVTEMPGTTRTAVDAAAAVGCDVAQIVKSLLFTTESFTAESIRNEAACAWLILASGPNRVDTDRLAEHLGESVSMADPKTVRSVTGFAIGGVAPLGLTEPIPVLMDEDLLAHDVVWAAAGTPKSVFPIDPNVLREATEASVLRITGNT